MKDVTRLQTLIYRGKKEQAQELAELMLTAGVHPLRILNESVVPAVEQSGAALEAGLYRAADLPEFGRTLQGVLKKLSTIVRDTSLSLQFAIGTVRYDAFDLWRGVVRWAFRSAGFKTLESSKMNRCEMIGLCQLMDSGVERMREHSSAESLIAGERRSSCEILAQA